MGYQDPVSGYREMGRKSKQRESVWSGLVGLVVRVDWQEKRVWFGFEGKKMFNRKSSRSNINTLFKAGQ